MENKNCHIKIGGKVPLPLFEQFCGLWNCALHHADDALQNKNEGKLKEGPVTMDPENLP